MTPAAAGELVILHLGCDDKKTPEALGLRMFKGPEVIHPPMRMVNLDCNPHVEPDLLCRLGRDPIDLPDDSVDFVVALHVLEHIGDNPGDITAWFQCWEQLYRVMKHGAGLQFECPYFSSVWAWADPTHVRGISEMTFLYLNQDSYRLPGAIPDYRPRFDFVAQQIEKIPDHTNADIAKMEPVSFIRGYLKARKPLRPYWEDAR